MISTRLDFDEFIRVVQDLSYDQIIARAQEEWHEVMLPIYARKSGAPEYENLLGGLLWLLCTNSKPSGVSRRDLLRMRPVFERLIRRSQLEHTVLGIFV